MPLMPDQSETDCCYEYGCRRSSKIAEKMRSDAECREILKAARQIIADRRDKKQQEESEINIGEVLQSILEEQKILKDLLKKQNEEISSLKKDIQK